MAGENEFSDLNRRITVRRFAREACNYWASMQFARPRRMFLADGLAEGEELGSNIL
jgi:hypothetical protein